jgi:membrane-associated phospholipid phosphatase
MLLQIHYPSDIIAGLALGIAWVLLTNLYILTRASPS